MVPWGEIEVSTRGRNNKKEKGGSSKYVNAQYHDSTIRRFNQTIIRLFDNLTIPQNHSMIRRFSLTTMDPPWTRRGTIVGLLTVSAISTSPAPMGWGGTGHDRYRRIYLRNALKTRGGFYGFSKTMIFYIKP